MNKIHKQEEHFVILGVVILILLIINNALLVSAASNLSYKPVIGAVTDSSAAVYARTDTSSRIQLLYGLNPDLSDGVLAPSEPITTVAEHDFVGHIYLSSLTPETRYYYSVIVDGIQSATQNFKTFPTADTIKDFRFALFSDSDINTQTAVYPTAGLDNPDFLLQTGDFSHNNPASEPGQLINSWWNNNRGALDNSFYGRHYTNDISIPFIHIWDDHDYGANNGTKNAKYKAVAAQAFLDYFPTYNRPNPSGGLWQSFRYGQAEFFILDLRSQKDPSSITDDMNKSMLDGDKIANDQKTWLKNGLTSSTAKWKFIISSLTWNPTIPKPEAWLGFKTEQDELVNFIKNNNIAGIIFLSGDIHSGGGIDDGTNSFFPEITIPNSNKGPTACSSNGDCGIWSHGVISPGKTLGGYVIVDVKADGHIELMIKDYYGKTYKLANITPDGTLTNQDYPNPSQYSLTVTNPNTNTNWAIGSIKKIKWSHNIGNVIPTYSRVELSRNNGATWEVLAPDVLNGSNSGIYAWTVTGPAATSALVRVSTFNGLVNDVSDVTFKIVP